MTMNQDKLREELDDVYQKVLRCFEAGALATGSKLKVIGGDKPFAHLEHDMDLAVLYQRNAEMLGRKFPGPNESSPATPVSTDMGNVSQVFPSIHPMLSIGEKNAVNHQPEYAAATLTEGGHKAIYDGAYAMGASIIDLAEKNLWDKL